MALEALYYELDWTNFFLTFFFSKTIRESGARHGMSRIISSLERREEKDGQGSFLY